MRRLCLPLLSPLLLAAGVERQTSVRTVGSFSENPKSVDLFGYDTEASNKLLVRESVQYRPTEALKLELNVYNLLLGSTDKGSASTLLLSGTDEKNRSPDLERHWHTSHKLDGYLTVDRLNVRGHAAGTDFAIGRFPIDLSTTALFTPNDLFAPYRPYNYYREYKPGVDALRIDRAIGHGGQVSVMGVAGYASKSIAGRVGTPMTRRFEEGESSVLARASYTLMGFEGAVLGGKHGEYDLGGFSLQGEVGPIGIRAEGHQKNHRRVPLDSSEVAAGIDWRPVAPLLLQVEQFFHGSGYPRAKDYAKLKDDPDPPIMFIGRDYSGVAADWELSPLTHLKTMLLGNWSDTSALLSTNLEHAVAENAAVSVSLLVPRGKGQDGDRLRSEFGTYPRILTVETGIYW